MKKFEKDLIIGTVLTFLGYLLLVWKGFHPIASWAVIIIGKFVIFLSVMEYKDYKRAFRGEDLNKDNILKKEIRKLNQKRYK